MDYAVEAIKSLDELRRYYGVSKLNGDYRANHRLSYATDFGAGRIRFRG